MKTYIAVHQHEYGATAYPFRSELPGFQNEQEVAAKLNIDFEPLKEESLEIIEVDLGSIPTI